MIGLKRPVLRNAEVGRLLAGELGELDPELGQMQRRNLFVELLRQHIHTDGILTGLSLIHIYLATVQRSVSLDA